MRVSLLGIHSAACALQERAEKLLRDARSLRKQLSRTISSRTAATRKNSGTARSKACVTTATSASSKRKKTPARGRALTAGQVNKRISRCQVCRDHVQFVRKHTPAAVFVASGLDGFHCRALP